MTAQTMPHEILDLERQYWSAVQHKDSDAAVQLTDNACIMASTNGVRRVEREALPQMMRQGSTEVREFTIGPNVQVRLLTNDVAIVAYEVSEELTVNGKPITLDAVDASTWVRRDGQWLCALHTESIKGDKFRVADADVPPARHAGFRSQIAQAMSAMPHLRYGSAVSPAMPDAVEEPDISK
jgi:uncharacterized protein (TIGR02246 family)